MTIDPTARTRLGRAPQRGVFDRETVYAILDEAPICHVAFVSDGLPAVIPTLHWRNEDRLYLHGSTASRTMRALTDGADVCIAASILDGFVLARSAFHHSVNYRSVIVYGRAEMVPASDQAAVLRGLIERFWPGRWDELRPITEQELKATTGPRRPLHEASAKVRTGDPNDEPEDMDWPVWAGVQPIALHTGQPQPESHSLQTPLPPYL